MRAVVRTLLILSACLISAPLSAQISDSREALFAKYRCPLSDLLRQVFEAPSAYQQRNRYLVLSPHERPADYVQCMFGENRSKLYCEASSGYYVAPDNKPRIRFPSEEMKAVLRKLGFATGNDEKNFPYEHDFSGAPDFGEIATMMLSAMHDAYGARADTIFSMRAPFAKKVMAKCDS